VHIDERNRQKESLEKWEEKIAMGHRYRMAINSRSSLGDKRSEWRDGKKDDEGRVLDFCV
jgi:hypothetical protein